LTIGLMTALGAFAGSLGLGLVALWSWLQLRAMRRWPAVEREVVAAELHTSKFEDGELGYFFRLDFGTPGLRRVVSPLASTEEEKAALTARFAPGTRHALFVDPKSGEGVIELPASSLDPTWPAIFAIVFLGAGVAALLGWLPTLEQIR
jgi:hypothetical protein